MPISASLLGALVVPDEWRVAAHFVAGGVAGMAARTVIAPIERVKIIFQTRTGAAGQTS